MTRRGVLALLTVLLCVTNVAAATHVAAAERVRLATTTSTENSGLLADLVPRFRAATGLEVDVVAVGTGQALELGRRGDADVLLTHDRAGEELFVAEGHGTDRRDVMYNDFVIVGPADDPAGVRGAATTSEALQRIARAQAPFLSRGDDSGTHRKERRLWQAAGLEPDVTRPWYRESGSGMGRTLNTAVQMQAYTLTDRGTWLSFNNKQDFAIAFEQDPPLNNPYSSVLVASPLLSSERRARAQAWHDWLTSREGQAAIDAFRVNGQPLFFAAGRSREGAAERAREG